MEETALLPDSSLQLHVLFAVSLPILLRLSTVWAGQEVVEAFPRCYAISLIKGLLQYVTCSLINVPR